MIGGIEDVLPGQVVETDVCIIGSGPAGLTLAGELAGSPITTLVVESGGLLDEDAGGGGQDIDSVGHPRLMEQRLVRNRMFGGTSHSWTGRCAPLDDIDFRRRPWVPFSGWPITADEVQPYLDRACTYLGLRPRRHGAVLETEPGYPVPVPQLDPRVVQHCLWQFSSDAAKPGDFMRFGPAFLARRRPNVRVMLQATASNLATDADGANVLSVELTGPGGEKVFVRPRAVVLCAGGVENARILLNSNRDHPAGVGNGLGVVGRFLMDHPRCVLASFAADQVAAIRQHYGLFRVGRPRGRNYFVRGLTLSPSYQEREGLLNCAAWLTEDRAPDDPWEAAKRLLSAGRQKRAQDAWAIASQPGLIVRGLTERVVRGRGVPHKLRRLVLDCIVEQRPDPDSRLSLGEVTDRFGLRTVRLDWRVSAQERATAAALGKAVAAEFRRLGLPVPRLAPWLEQDGAGNPGFVDACHPTGTTRMSVSPAEGVVDPSSRVHGMRNLFIAGSSTFPTTGHANPTLPIVALAIRLADHIKAEFGVSGGRRSRWADGMEAGA